MPYERRRGAGLLRITLALEDAAQAGVVRLLGLLGRREITVLPFIGYGTPDRIRVRGRVVLGRPAARLVTADLAGDVPTGGDPRADVALNDRWAAWRHRWDTFRESMAPFLTVEVPGCPVIVHRLVMRGPTDSGSVESGIHPSGADPGGADRSGADRSGADRTGADRSRADRSRADRSRADRSRTDRSRAGESKPAEGGTAGRTDRQGYLDVPVDVGGLTPGWHRVGVTATLRGRSAEAELPVLVIDPRATLAVVSDLDDTVIESGIARGLEVLRLTLLTEVTKRTPLPGAAELYQALSAPRDGGGPTPVFYLSTSPWNLYELLTRFLVLRGFPAGPLLLTDWGPSRTSVFRVPTEEHKLTLIRALLAEHPALRVVLLGDTGQLDPEIYATIAQEAPDRIRAIYVRRTTGMRAGRAVELHGLARRVAACGVPMLVVDDSVQIAEHAARIGLLEVADVQRVRGST
jgi:phosphatidate phosphatase APP1